MNRTTGCLLIFVLAAFNGCIEPEPYPIEPQITFLSLSRNSITQADTVKVQISFTDGDGDIGTDVNSVTSCYPCNNDTCDIDYSSFSLIVTDKRLPDCPILYKVPYIPEQGKYKSISGKVDIVMPSTYCLSEGNAFDTVFYALQLIDRAGHFSNEVEIPQIVVTCH